MTFYLPEIPDDQPEEIEYPTADQRDGQDDSRQDSGQNPLDQANDLKDKFDTGKSLKDKLAGGGEGASEAAAGEGAGAATGSGGAAAEGVTAGSGGAAAATGGAAGTGAAGAAGTAGAATGTGAAGAAGSAGSAGISAGVGVAGGALSATPGVVFAAPVALTALAINKKSRKALIAVIVSIFGGCVVLFAIPLLVVVLLLTFGIGNSGSGEAAEAVKPVAGENEFAKVEKLASIASVSQGPSASISLKNEQLPQTTRFDISIVAKKNISGLTCTDSLTLIKKDGSLENLPSPNLPTSCPASLTAGTTFNLSFDTPLPNEERYKDAVLTNAFNVQASSQGNSSNLDYSIPFRDTTVKIIDEEDVRFSVSSNPRWPGNLVNTECEPGLSCWDYVKREAIKGEANPAFILAIWIAESGASNSPGHLSCPNGGIGLPEGIEGLKLSVNCFVNGTPPFLGAGNYPPDQFARMLDDFCDPGTVEICQEPPDKPKTFIASLKSWYSNLVPSGNYGAMTLLDSTGTGTSFTLSTTAQVIIGNAGRGCFTYEGPWTSEEMATENAAIAHISQAPAYFNKLCSYGGIVLQRRSGPYNTVTCPNKINIVDQGIGSLKQTAFTLAHESGHILQCKGDPTWREFTNQGISSEGFICSYPYSAVFGSGGGVPSEDYAEMIGIYVSWPNFSTALCGQINYPSQYPLHYQFAKNQLFGGYEFR